jgi:hypothetical protein
MLTGIDGVPSYAGRHVDRRSLAEQPHDGG